MLTPLLAGTKARLTALHIHDGRLYAGAADGSLRIYSLLSRAKSDEAQDDTVAPELLSTHPLAKRQIDQMAVLAQSRMLVVLSDSVVTLHKLDSLGLTGSTTVLTTARTAHAFAATTYFTHLPPQENKDAKGGKGAGGDKATTSGSSTPTAAPERVQRDLLVVGCRKRVVVYGAGRKLGEAWDLGLPHSPRHVIFAAPVYADLPQSIHLLYSPQASVILSLRSDGPAAQRLSVIDVPNTGYPSPRGGQHARAPETATGGFSALSGFGNMLKAAAIPVGTRTVGGEVCLVRDGDLGVFFSSEATFTRNESLQWPAAPESMAFANPYIFSVVPSPPTAGGALAQPSIHIHLASTLAHRQTVTFPAPSAGSLTVSAVTVTPSASRAERAHLVLVSTPTDRNLLQSEGSTVWELRGADVSEEVDELVREGRMIDAIGLVEAVGDNDLAPTRRLPHLRVLHALSQFARGDYKPALEAFISNNVHPAKVVALYPKESISGNLAVPRDEWMSLFGAVEGARLEPPPEPQEEEEAPRLSILRNAHLALGRKRSSDTINTLGSAAKDDDASAASDQHSASGQGVAGATLPRQAIDELIYYLSDRRQKLAGAIPLLSEPMPLETDVPPLSSVSAADIHTLPDGPLTDLTPEQLLRTAQVIYTSLLKVYLVARPTLVGSLCRIENWCDVAEVEPLLREKGRIDDLRDLYMQKGMHDKALGMLLEQAQGEDDPLDRYPPTVRYLQKLGPKHLGLIFESSKWIFKEDPGRALQIFTADEPEVDALPRTEVAAFLEKEHWPSAISYLEHIIELGETGAYVHDQLVQLYIRRLREASGEARDDALKHLLKFLNSSKSYRAYRILQSLEPDEALEARAVLLGRMGNHDEALRIYVYRLKDYAAAEAYCARVYAKDPDPSGIFLHLLKLYLQPKPPAEPLVTPALSLVARHGTRIEPRAVLQLLPPLVPVRELTDFFIRTLGDERARRNEHRIVRGLLAARKQEVERVVVDLEVKRVRVTDQRICPQCQKRLGQSAIAVHAPHGEVTHLHCKDQFSARLAAQRG